MKLAKWIFPLAAVAHLASLAVGCHVVAVVSKPLLMPSLALLVAARPHGGKGGSLASVMAALTCGTLGDVLLMLPGSACFMAGMLAFFAGHVCYFLAIPRQWRGIGLRMRLALALLLCFLVAVVIAVALQFPVKGAMRVCVVTYALAFAFLIHASVAAALAMRMPAYLVTALAFVIFAVSDVLVGVGAFTGIVMPGRGLAVMSTYVIAQGLAALSIVRGGAMAVRGAAGSCAPPGGAAVRGRSPKS